MMHINAIAGPVHPQRVAAEDVVHAPARIHLVDLHAVLDAVGPGIALDQPGIALDVDPRRSDRRVHAGPVEPVIEDLAASGALLDVDVLRGGTRDVIAGDHVPVAAVRLAAAVLAPVLVRRPDVDAFTEERAEQAGVPDQVAAHRVVAAERAQVDRLVTDLVHGQARDQVVARTVRNHALLAVLHGEALDPPPGRPLQVQDVAGVGAAAVEYGAARAAQRDGSPGGARSRHREMTLVLTGGQHDDLAGSRTGQRLLEVLAAGHRRRGGGRAGGGRLGHTRI